MDNKDQTIHTEIKCEKYREEFEDKIETKIMRKKDCGPYKISMVITPNNSKFKKYKIRITCNCCKEEYEQEFDKMEIKFEYECLACKNPKIIFSYNCKEKKLLNFVTPNNVPNKGLKKEVDIIRDPQNIDPNKDPSQSLIKGTFITPNQASNKGSFKTPNKIPNKKLIDNPYNESKKNPYKDPNKDLNKVPNQVPNKEPPLNFLSPDNRKIKINIVVKSVNGIKLNKILEFDSKTTLICNAPQIMKELNIPNVSAFVYNRLPKLMKNKSNVYNRV